MRTGLILIALASTPTFAGEGKWTPQQVLELGPGWVKAQGFALPLAKLWDKKKGTGLLSNAVQLPGCSGSFVSGDGLLVSNHHCIVSILQEHSTPAHNLVEDGYVARTRADEKQSKAFRIQVPRAFRDVTDQVRAQLNAAPGDKERFDAMETIQKSLVAACEQEKPGPGATATRCTFAAFDGGVTFTLTVFDELSDVRLVWAPPRGVGEYGGETDNWAWPRHTGDFALVRAYSADGQPYHPQYFFPLSATGVKPGDAVAVLGYPGVSYRGLLAREMEERAAVFFPTREAWMTEWISILEETTKGSPEGTLAASDDLRGFINVKKNAQGQVAGIARGKILAKQKEAEARVVAAAAKAPEALEAKAALEGLLDEKLKTWDRDFTLDFLGTASRALGWPVTLARVATERVKPDLEREPGYQDRDLPRTRERLARDQKRLFVPADKKLTLAWVKHALALPEPQHIAAIDAAFASAKDDAELGKRIDALYAKSKVLNADDRAKMLEETPAALQARKDPLVDLGFALDAERKALKTRRDAWSGAALKHRPAWRAAVTRLAGKPLAPDANSTLRATFCRVSGYSPKDGMLMTPQTTLSGMVAKHTGVAPFNAPLKLLDAAQAGKLGRWKDKALNDVPVAFLSDCDTTGGNSGSPTIDANGKLVGVNFDRVWENVANDFGYNPDIARNVNADARYLLWQLEEVDGATHLVKELGI